MSDRMDKEAMEKYYSYIKNYYPPTGYPVRHPYYSLPPHEDKDRKTPDNYSQMYGYPPYSPYQMPPMGYPQQHYPTEHEHDKHEEEKPKHEMPNPYAHYYPYSPYPYYNPYAYPPYYYAQRDYANKSAPLSHMGMSSPHGQHPTHSLYSSVPQVEPSPSPMKILSKPQDKAVKQEIVISSDSEDANLAPVLATAPASTPAVTVPQPIIAPPSINPPNNSFASLIPLLKPAPPPSKPEKMDEEEPPVQKKDAEVVNIEDEGERDPFLIRKKQKIAKEEKVKAHKGIKNFPQPERQRQINTRYAGMPSETYQEMIKKQTRMRLELFYQRERQRKEQERSKDHEKQKEKDIISKDLKDIKSEKNEKEEKEKDEKKSTEDKSQKDKKERPIGIYRITAALTTGIVPEDARRQRQRIKDDHPLKELRYNESHGRIRLGAYFQSTIPSLLRHQEVASRKVDLQKRLREREVAAVTF